MNSYFFIPLILQKIIWVPTRIILVVFGRLEVSGLENLYSLPSPVIFACNHSSEIDPFIVPASLPFWSRFSPIFYTTKERKFYSQNGWRKYLFGGFFIKMWGGYTAYTGLRDYQKSLSPHINVILHGGSFCIFPEGGITKDGNLQSSRGGMAYLAERAGCSIVPVAISGVYGLSPLDFFLGGFARKHKVRISFRKAIAQEELKNNFPSGSHLGENTYRKKGDYVMERIRGALLQSAL
ncbi:MAG: lysophospholipid acyltransferase family protein [bacterium]|nr:lysophospholipid acyltransferase family protein [bacterium]